MNLISHRSPIWTVLACIALACAGCKSADTTTSASSSASGRGRATGDASPNAALLTQVERSHVIGPMAAGELEYRVAWQYIGSAKAIRLFTQQGDSVFFLDDQNYLTRIGVNDGNRMWQRQVADPIEEVLGITFPGDRVYVTTGGAMLVLDAGTGSQIDRQSLHQIANTEPVMYGPYLIYGSRSGQLAWHNGLVGAYYRGYKVANSVIIPPVLDGDLLVAVGNDGTIMSLSANSARQYWSKRLLAPIMAAPAVGNGAVFVAGLDQYLWAFNATTGRNLWKVLTPAQLTDSPTLIGERVYQQIPGQGLFCFEAQPADSPGGVQVWTAPAVNGNVILMRRSELLVWDDGRGSMIKNIDLPAATRLLVGGPQGSDLFAANNDGRVVRLVPRN